MAQHTVLYEQHLAASAKMVDFHGWQMPLHYGSQVEEHHQVRQDCGVFDVSHMTVVDIQGAQAKAFLQRLLANDVDKLTVAGKAMYGGMLNHEGGVIDDLITYYMGLDPQGNEHYRIVVNSATRVKDLEWIGQQAQSYQVEIIEQRHLAMIAIQGPNAMTKAQTVFSAEQRQAVAAMKPFFAVQTGDWFIATTGYTGEAGYEIILPEAQAPSLWQALVEAGIAPCGLGARDTLRLEAGMNLYGQDMDETISPLSANMGWTIAWEPTERDFIGREVLMQQRHQQYPRLVGLVMTQKGVLRSGMTVYVQDPQGIEHQGVITSGSFSPTLGHAIALARLPLAISGAAQVAMRNKRVDVQIVKPCFVRNGKPAF